VRYIVNVN